MATIDSRGVRIEYVSLAELQRWPRNPKGHDLGAIHESYNRFGYVMPMLLDERTGRLAVGHGRLDALQQRKASGEEAPGGIRASDGAWSVPVVRGVSFESDGEMDAYVVADNRSTETGGWDEPGLAAILADLAAGEEGLQGVGFDEDDLDVLLERLAQREGIGEAPKFSAVSGDEQSRLDQRNPVTCPKCGHDFLPDVY